MLLINVPQYTDKGVFGGRSTPIRVFLVGALKICEVVFAYLQT